MEKEELKALIDKAMEDESFVKRLMDVDLPEEAQRIFAEKGIELTIDEIKAIADNIREESDELNEDNLENVSGGNIIGLWPRFPGWPKFPFPRRPGWPLSW